MGSTYLSLGIYGGYHCMGGPHCQSLELLSRVSLLLSSVWRCTWSLAYPGKQDLIPCVFSHAVWEGSSHPGLSIHGFSLFLPSSMPFTCPLSLGSVPSFPFREGLLSQQTTYCTCQQEQLHLGPLTRTLSFLLFFPAIWSTLLGHHSLCCPAPAALLLYTHLLSGCCQCNSLGSKLGCDDLKKTWGPGDGSYWDGELGHTGMTGLRKCLPGHLHLSAPVLLLYLKS